jgi:YD repeat-containing protein
VTHLNGTQKYWYDANGNVTKRIFGSDTYDLYYDAEGKMVSVKKNSVDYASFVYDGDGNRVKGTINGTTITYMGNYADWSGSSLIKYYYAGTMRNAMDDGPGAPNYLISIVDHFMYTGYNHPHLNTNLLPGGVSRLWAGREGGSLAESPRMPKLPNVARIGCRRNWLKRSSQE